MIKLTNLELTSILNEYAKNKGYTIDQCDILSLISSQRKEDDTYTLYEYSRLLINLQSLIDERCK